MRLHDLVDNRQPQARATREAGLQWLEDLQAMRGIDARSGIAKADAYPERNHLERHNERAPIGHGPQRVVAQIPENLLDAVRVHARAYRTRGKLSFNLVLPRPLQLRMLLQES